MLLLAAAQTTSLLLLLSCALVVLADPWVCTFPSAASECEFSDGTHCIDLETGAIVGSSGGGGEEEEAERCAKGPNGVYFAASKGTNASLTTVVAAYGDPACSSPVPLFNWPELRPGACAAVTSFDGRPVIHLKVFTRETVHQCLKCLPKDLENVDEWWVCAHVDGACSMQENVSCVRPRGECAALALPLDFEFRTIGIKLSPPTAESNYRPELELYNPPFEYDPGCTVVLMGTLWDYKQPFSASGQCLVFDQPAVKSPLPDVLYLSVHVPDCPSCPAHEVNVDMEAGSGCRAHQTEQECLEHPACDFTQFFNFGCADQAQFLAGQSQGATCALAAKDECDHPRLQHFCILNERNQCIPHPGGSTTGSFGPLVHWFVSTLDRQDLTFAAGGISEDFALQHAYITNTHSCSVLSSNNHLSGILFSGWQQWVVNPDGCSSVNFTSNILLNMFVSPAAEHGLDPEDEIMDGSGNHNGFVGQRFVVAPPLQPSPGLLPEDLVVGISCGTNGVSVYGFNFERNISYTLLAWKADDALEWAYVGLEIQADSIMLWIDGDMKRKRSLPSNTRLFMCPAMLGYSPLGSFHGLVRMVTLSKPGNSETGDVGISSLLYKGCVLHMEDLNVTSGALFISKPVEIHSQALGGEPKGYSNIDATFFLKPGHPTAVSINATSGVLSVQLEDVGPVEIQVGVTTTEETCSQAELKVAIMVLPPVRATVDTSVLDLQLTSRAPSFTSGQLAKVAGGDGRYSFRSTPLPKGLRLNPRNGVISGRTEESGQFPVSVTVTDRLGGSDSFDIILTVHPPIRLQGQPAFLTEGWHYERAPTATAGGLAPFRYRLQVAGSHNPVQHVWGLQLNRTSGVLSGIPQASSATGDGLRGRRGAASVLPVSLTVEDSQGSVATEQFELTLFPKLNVSVPIVMPAEVLVRQNRNVASLGIVVSVEGGRPAYDYFVEGAPPGVSVSSDGLLVGFTRQEGRYAVVLCVRDANGAVACTLPVLLLVEDRPSRSSDSGLGTEGATTIAVAIVLLAVLLCVLLWLAKKQPLLVPHDYAEEQEALADYASFDGPAVTPQEINARCIEIIETLGSGNFGEVFKAMYAEPGGTRYLVAVKQVKAEGGREAKQSLLQEALLMAQIRHPHIVGIIGAVTATSPEMMVMQYMEHGSLQEYLKKGKGIARVSGKARFLIARDICSGMAFLEAHGIVHRDLAARNVLVDSQHRCAVADFGRARNLNNSEYYRSRQATLPIRWMAPEALQECIYTVKSDVFSYAVTLMEVWNNGRIPWRHLSDTDDVGRAVCAGQVMPCPSEMPRRVYELLLRCWSLEQEARPSFAELLDWLSSVVVVEV